jgi:AraC-like DNA-binding protein
MNRIEISILKTDYIVKIINNIKYTYKNAYTLSCNIADGNQLSSYSYPDTKISVTTVAVEFDKMDIIFKKLDTKDYVDKTHLLLPLVLDSIPTDELDELNVLLHKYIIHDDKNTEHDKIICYSIIYQLLSKIDAHVRNALNGTTKKTYHHYIKKTNQIIQNRYNTKLTKGEIAKELGISVGYLTLIYKKSTGKTISEQLLATRMHKAEILLENQKMSTSKIATSVGYDNETYFREKFKEFFGMSIKEYKNIKHGNTLYHNKPIKN